MGTTPNPLKLLTLNVNGIAQFDSRNGVTALLSHDADIIVLSEVKDSPKTAARREHIWDKFHAAGYTYQHFNVAPQSTSLPLPPSLRLCTQLGYAGLAILSRVPPLLHADGSPRIELGLGDTLVDIEPRAIVVHYQGFVLVAVYAPSSGKFLLKLNRKLLWNRSLGTLVSRLNSTGTPFVVIGDLNSTLHDSDDFFADDDTSRWLQTICFPKVCL